MTGHLTYIIRKGPGGYTVGHYDPEGFNILALFDGRDDAVAFANRLNFAAQAESPSYWVDTGTNEVLR